MHVAGFNQVLYTQLIKNYGNINAENTIKDITAIVQTGAWPHFSVVDDIILLR